MKPRCHYLLQPLHWFVLSLALTSREVSADTLIFSPSIDPATGNISELWSYLGNWYFSINPSVQATHLPAAGDTVNIFLSEFACQVDVPAVSLAALNTKANIIGGNFSVATINSANTTFNGSALNVLTQWMSQNDQLVGAHINIMSGSLLFVNNGTLYVNNGTLYDAGQIELMDGGELAFSSGTNTLTITTNAQLTSVGTNSIQYAAGYPLTFDNNGVVQSQGGNLIIESDSITWTNSLGVGYFTNATSNAVITIDGPFMVQSNCTNYVSGPGVLYLNNGTEITIDGVLQIGLNAQSPGAFDYHAYDLIGTGSIDLLGGPGTPSTLIWESGTFSGPTINIDTQSVLLITNIYQKTITASVLNNAGSATWLVDGTVLELDNGAVFNNPGSFTAANNAVLQGGAGSNASFFYNGGAFVKSGSTGLTSFEQDNEPAPSFYFINSGTLDVESGAVYAEWGTNSGRYNVAPGAALHFWAGTNAQTTSATYTGPGSFVIDGGNIWLDADQSIDHLMMVGNGAIDGPGDLTVATALELAGGSLLGSGSVVVNADASLIVATNPVTCFRDLVNLGTILITNSSVQTSQSITWSNLANGTINLAAGSLGYSIGQSSTPPTLVNAGRVFNSGPSNITSTVGWAVTNSGTITANAYALEFDQPVVQLAGVTTVNAGATLSVSSISGHTFEIQGGVVEGNGTLSASIINSGAIHPGDSPGILTLGFGTLTNLPGATLAVDIAGTTTGTQYGQVDGSGVVWLDNMGLIVTLGSGFVPSLGDSYVIWTNAQFDGTFSYVQEVSSVGGVALVPRYGPGSIILLAASDPSPSLPTLNGQTFGFSFQTTAGLTNVVQFATTLYPVANWQPLTNIVGNGRLRTIADSAATNSVRFYRVTFE